MVCQEVDIVEIFFGVLVDLDLYFEQLRVEVEVEGKVLWMIVKLEGVKVIIGLEVVGVDYLFYNLSGSDNMIVFIIECYKDCLFVVCGFGVGVVVIVVGVFVEIIIIGNYFS